MNLRSVTGTLGAHAGPLTSALTPASISASVPASAPASIRVSGLVRGAEPGKPLVLTVAALETLPQYSLTTNAPWTREPHTYQGVLLRDLLAHLHDQAGADGGAVGAPAGSGGCADGIAG